METSAESDNHSIAASGAGLIRVGGSTASEGGGGSTAGAQEDSDRQRAAPSQECPQGEGGAEEQEEESTRQQQVQIAGGDEDNGGGGGGNGTSVSVAVSACSVTAESASTTAAVHVVASSRSEKLQEGSSSSTNHRQDDSQTDDGAETEPTSTCAAPTTHANAKADMEQEQSQHETEDGEDPHFDASDTSIALPDEAMAARSGYHLNLSSLPPGAYLVEPAYPTAYPRASSSSGEQVMTAEVRLARDGEGEGTEEDESTTDGASRSSMSTLTMNHPSIAASRRSSGGTGVIAASRQSSGGTGVSTAGASTAGANTDDAIVHHVVTATCVDEECIVDAHPVPDEGEMVLQVRAERDEHRQQVVTLRKRQHRLVLGGGVLALAVLAVALGVVFGNNGGNNEGGDTASAAEVDADRLEALRAIVLPLSGRVFDPTLLAYSEQRVAALDWLANDRYATERLPTDDPSLTWKIRQRYVMGLFHIMTDSPNWFDDFNSLTDRDECDWNRASSLQGQEAEDIYSGVEKEVEVKGIICDESGRVKRIILWWNNLSGQLPHELSNLSESLIDLNVGGGSISGPIPDSYGNLTKLGGLSLFEHCLTGTVPESLSQLPEMMFLSLHGNIELGGSLNGLCDGDQFRSGTSLSYVSADCGDCPGSETSIKCECCTCCDSNTFDCCGKDGDALYKYINYSPNPSNGRPLSFERDCLTEEGALWAQEECPCVIYETEDQVYGKCTKECSDG